MIPTALITIIISLAPISHEKFEVITKEGKFSIANSLPDYSISYEILEEAVKNKELVMILYDKSSNKISFVSNITKDRVKEVSEDSKHVGKTTVTLMLRPSRVNLNKTNPHYSEILTTLKNSQKNHNELIIGINPITMCIEAVKNIK